MSTSTTTKRDEWTIEGDSLVGRRRIRDAMNYWVADVASDDRAEQIVAEHNSLQSLATQLESQAFTLARVTGERDRLRQALVEVAIPSLRYYEQKYDHDDQARLNLEAALEDYNTTTTGQEEG